MRSKLLHTDPPHDISRLFVHVHDVHDFLLNECRVSLRPFFIDDSLNRQLLLPRFHLRPVRVEFFFRF